MKKSNDKQIPTIARNQEWIKKIREISSHLTASVSAL